MYWIHHCIPSVLRVRSSDAYKLHLCIQDNPRNRPPMSNVEIWLLQKSTTRMTAPWKPRFICKIYGLESISSKTPTSAPTKKVGAGDKKSHYNRASTQVHRVGRHPNPLSQPHLPQVLGGPYFSIVCLFPPCFLARTRLDQCFRLRPGS